MEADDVNGRFHVSWGARKSQMIENFFDVKFKGDYISFRDSLYTPKFLGEETLMLVVEYDMTEKNTTFITSDISYPGTRRVGSSQISFQSLMNMNGTLHVLNPFKNFSDATCQFLTSTNE
ncbi:hypothetical protein QAD02_007138 [Eretmocerus hayati]|uniref:Uncharacterized protein n=1 Tax=Eretmocerus hayati TaxID=131215 RepID=A0ACC2N3P0_9HYME|nr:hypothetical protein QAD02_007138 [Eretmocerus hayati]